MRRLISLVALAVVASACASSPSVEVQSPEGAQQTEDEVAMTAPENLAWEHLGQVEANLPDRAAAAVLEDQEAVLAAWDRYGFAGGPPEVGFDDHVLLLLGQADDACPDELIRLEVVEGNLQPDWLAPPGGCNQPLVQRLHAIRVHRSVLGERFTYGLEDPFDDVFVDVTIELPPYDGETPPAPEPPTAMTEAELDAVFAGHPVSRCGPEHEVIDFGPGGTHDPRPVATIEEANAALVEAGFDPERDVVPFVERSSGGRLSYVVAADDEASIRAVFAEAFGDEAPDLRVTRWAPAEVADAMEAVQPLMGGGDIGEPGSIVWAAGAPGPVELGMIDPTREALDAIAELVDPELVCVSPELSGVRPADR